MLLDVARASGRKTAMLVHGPRGSGKRAVARAVHELSGVDGPLALMSASATPAQTHAAQIHGHASRPGLWETCTGGTLVLRDIDALSPEGQRALIHGLDTGLGPRLVALTRCARGQTDLLADLRYRLSLEVMVLPSLQDRDVDIELIAERHLRGLGVDADGEPWRLTDQARAALRSYPWPGNIRELLSTLDRAAHQAQRTPIRRVHLGLQHPATLTSTAPLAVVERRVVEQALADLDGNVAEAGRQLGIPRSTLYRKLKRWGLR